MPIEWMVEEESPIGSTIGTVKDRLAILNNASQWLDRTRFKLDYRSETQAFLLDAKTGMFTGDWVGSIHETFVSRRPDVQCETGL